MTKINWWIITQKKLCSSKLYGTLSYFSFYSYWLCVCISYFASLLSSAKGSKICAIPWGTEKYRPVNYKKQKKRDKIVSLERYKLNSIEVLMSKALIDTKILAYLSNNFIIFLKCKEKTDSKNQRVAKTN